MTDTVFDTGPAPTAFTATSRYQYVVPDLRPLSLYDVAFAAGFASEVYVPLADVARVSR